MKNKKNKEVKNQNMLKRKKGETFQFDIYINRINQITIENLNNASKLTIIEENNIILAFPSYLRKKKVNRYHELKVDTSQSKFIITNSSVNKKKLIWEHKHIIL